MYFTNIFCRQGKRVGFQKDPKRVADWERSCAEGLRTRVGEKDAIIRGRPVWEWRLRDSTMKMGDCRLVGESTLGDLLLPPLRTGEPFAGTFTYKQLFNTNKGPCQIKKLSRTQFWTNERPSVSFGKEAWLSFSLDFWDGSAWKVWNMRQILAPLVFGIRPVQGV